MLKHFNSIFCCGGSSATVNAAYQYNASLVADPNDSQNFIMIENIAPVPIQMHQEVVQIKENEDLTGSLIMGHSPQDVDLI